ncbi:MAG: endo-1,4-beta-xylanase [Treponema sp.]|jgi:GH35 family endo-1,4-beta-xylanase|nr:endo-1,4-beta-xylanase [Treponema sp.]
MKKSLLQRLPAFGLFLAIALMFGVAVIGCETGKPNTDKNEYTVTFTIGNKKSIVDMLPKGVTAGSVSWESNAPAVASVSKDGIVSALGITTGGNNTFVSGPATGIATITAKADGDTVLTVTVNTTTAAQVDLMTLPPLKDTLKDHFPMTGNILSSPTVEITGTGAGLTVSNPQLLRHFNALTAENHMKPSYFVTGRTGTTFTYNWNSPDRFVNAAYNSGFKVIGHTLLWHSQSGAHIANIPGSLNAADALTAMENYITEVVTRYKGKIHTWDVLNEVFPDNVNSGMNWENVMRKTGDSQAPNPWYVAIGSDFVYKGFLAARFADPDAILYYNDYNTEQEGKATMIRNMVRDVNIRYKAAYPSASHSNNGTRNLIEGIGMQEHHNLSVTPASIRKSLQMFKEIGVKVSVSELDVLGNANYSAFSSSTGQGGNKHTQSAVTNTQLITQAARFREYMAVYLEFKDIIERISLWGITDNQSWRSGGLPLLFDHNGRAKPAYYSFIEALK